MKIVHLCFLGPFTENWSYQENLLTKHQALNGHQVTIITSCFKHIENGNVVKVDPCDYFIDNGIRVIRLNYTNKVFKGITLLHKYNILKYLNEIKPNLIFCHGIGQGSYLQLRKFYEGNLDCKIVADTHIYAELENYGNSLRSKLGNIFIKRIVRKTDYLFKKYYYVTPSCFEVAKNNWKVPSEKMELLPLGYDDNIIDISKKDELRKALLSQLNLLDDAIIITAGGKLNEEKNIHFLTKFFKDYVSSKPTTNIKLVIFGSFVEEWVSNEIKQTIDNKYIFYFGFLNQEEISNLYLGSDAAFFPGGQSVLWQHAIGCAIPLFLKKWPGLDYLNVSNNIYYLDDINKNDFYKAFDFIESNKFLGLKKNALSDNRLFFSYKSEAKKVLEK